MRRPGPRPLASALGDYTRKAAPATLLARVQACWPEAAGAAVAGESSPVSERGGTITVNCSSATWAHELELLAPDLLDRLNAALGAAAPGRVTAVRFRVGRMS